MKIIRDNLPSLGKRVDTGICRDFSEVLRVLASHMAGATGRMLLSIERSMADRI